jgi:hypothetical protein
MGRADNAGRQGANASNGPIMMQLRVAAATTASHTEAGLALPRALTSTHTPGQVCEQHGQCESGNTIPRC